MEIPDFIPPWEGMVEGYTKRKALSMSDLLINIGYEVRDAVQEGYLIYRECLDRYWSSVKSGAHFMALYKIVLHTRFQDLVFSKDAKQISIDSELVENNLKKLFVFEDSTLRVLLREMGKEVSQVLSVVFNTPSELVESLGLNKKRRRGFYNNSALCKYFGYDSGKMNLVKMVKEHFDV